MAIWADDFLAARESETASSPGLQYVSMIIQEYNLLIS